jgi:C-terminal processing protease CtpA/Prc
MKNGILSNGNRPWYSKRCLYNQCNQSAAAEAGLKEGDIIQSIDGTQLASSTEFSERSQDIDLTI